MKEDYLWNKKGKDQEIEKLEKTLQVFRSQVKEPPALPAKEISVSKPPRKFFQLAFAFAASLSFMLILGSVWILNPTLQESGKTEIARSTTENQIQQNTINKEIAVEPQKAEPNTKPPTKISPTVATIKSKKSKRFKTYKTSYKRKAPKRKRIRRKKPAQNKTVKLTKEEKHAYDQLMLALSITSSKLNIVRDKVRGDD